MNGYVQKMKEWFRVFMIGRYGPDELGFFLVLVGLFFQIMSWLLHSAIPSLITDVCLLFEVYRYFSKDLMKRRAENQPFLGIRLGFRRAWKLAKMAAKDPQNKYFICPRCGQFVRVPKGHGKVKITCPRCHAEFDGKS